MAEWDEEREGQVSGDRAAHDIGLQDFGDEPVVGARTAGAVKKKPVQSAADGCAKGMDALDEIRMLN